MTAVDAAWALLRSGEAAGALAAFRRLLSADGTDRRAMRGLALALSASGAYPDALGWIERALAGGGAPPAWSLDRAAILVRLGRREDAAAAVRAVPRGNDPAILAAAGDLLMACRAWADARDAYQAALALHPDHVAAWNNLGGALRELGAFAEAADAYRAVIARDPARFEAWANLAATLLRLDRGEAAVEAFDRALAIRPGQVALERTRATALRDLGRLVDALAGFDRALALEPDHAGTHQGRGVVLDRLGRLDDAINAMRQACQLAPRDADLHHDLGHALRRAGRSQSAIQAFRDAVRLKPDHGEALSGLGAMLWATKQTVPALEALRHAAEVRPDHADVATHYANALHAFGRQEESAAVFRATLRRHPDAWQARFSACIAELPIVYRDDTERRQARQRYQVALAALAAAPLPDDPAAIGRMAEALHARQPFYLAYQSENDRDLQALFGGMACRIMGARLPAYAAAPPRPVLAPGRRIRVGVLTAFFRHHSVWKVPLHSWLADLDPTRFAIHGYFPDSDGDAATEIARHHCARFVMGTHPVDRWAGIIRADDLHVLLIPEIGMDATTLQLAALRLAPVQATSWGHPQTSGLPTIDHFLSSDLMEPPDGDDHYTERLVRLPGLSFRRIPVPIVPQAVTRAEIGVDPGDIVYWCCQSLYKYLPADDDLLPRIAAAVPEARFLFVGYPVGDRVGSVIRDRMGAAFARAGLDAGRHCRFLGMLPSARFAGVARLADVFLDSVGWSGCNSTLESLDADLPVVTWPGRLMRGRHSLAILRLMGIEDTIAGSADEYVALAVRLARDPAWRADLRGRIAAAKGILGTDRSWLAGLDAYLSDAAGGGAAG